MLQACAQVVDFKVDHHFGGGHACTLPREWKEEDVEPQISRCKLWWEQAGKFRDWAPN
jgi:hypothetical protein